MVTTRSAYKRGYEAFEAGLSINDNPYQAPGTGSLNYKQRWELGWLDAEGLVKSSRECDPMDIHVGSRVRLRRMVIGISQEKLGERMGLTFQQIQKYEKGTNRIGASRLWRLAQILDVPVGYFFEDAPIAEYQGPLAGVIKTEAFLLDFLQSRDGLELNRAFVRITDSKVRKRIVELTRALVSEAEAQPVALSDLAREEAA